MCIIGVDLDNKLLYTFSGWGGKLDLRDEVALFEDDKN